MGFRDKLLDFKQRLSDRHMYSIVLVVTALIAGAGIYQYKRALDYRNYVENQYSRAFYELVGYVDDLEATLAKGMLVNSPRQMSHLSSELYRKAAFAQANLGQLPISHVQLDKTSKFLTQLGDYTYSLSRKAMDEQPISDEEYKQLENLQQYAAQLKNSLNEMQESISANGMRFGELQKKGSRFIKQSGDKISLSNLENIEKQFQEYPSLIYDGPFSDHIENLSPRMLEGAEEISQEQAQDIAIKFIGEDRAKNIEFTGEGNGAIPTYGFSVNSGEEDNNTHTSIAISKKGGHVLWMLNNRMVTRKDLNIDGAKEKANEFLDAKGYKSMKETYYITNNGVATINYAYMQDNIIMYPDLIKVKVALDTGEIVGFESQGYIMAHKDERELPAIKITQKQARDKINPRLQVDSTRLAVIPLESKREVLCYEFKGNYSGRNFLVYINAETGKEENILLLLETPNGILTI